MNDDREGRLAVLAVIVLAIFVVLLGRLAVLQIIRGPSLRAQSEANSVQEISIPAPRGLIEDRSGTVLVQNRPSWALILSPLPAKQKEATLNRLASLLGLNVKDLQDTIAREQAAPYQPVTLLKNLTPEQYTIVAEHLNELPGVTVNAEPLRQYLYGSLAAHVLGYVGPIAAGDPRLKQPGYSGDDIVGRQGLELQYDQYLKGVDGKEFVEVDALGRFHDIIREEQPTPGDTLKLTIDLQLQQAAENALASTIAALPKAPTPAPHARSGAVVAVDVNTGAVLAMASYPTFDPNWFATGLTKEQASYLFTDTAKLRPLLNRAIQGLYAPGSIFKPITAIAALETGVTTPQETIFDPGYYRIGNIIKRDWKAGGFGIVNMVKAIAQSVNVYFYTMGARLTPDILAQYAHMFGLGEKTGIDLPSEATGLMPDTAWRAAQYKAGRADSPDFWPGEKLDLAIGQGAEQFTPIQLAMYACALANGGTVYKPYLVSQIIAPDGSVVAQFGPQVRKQVQLSATTWDTIRQGMHAVTLPGGTAYYRFYDFPIPVAAKTGTAQTANTDNNGLFMAYAPLDHPEIAVVAVIEQGQSGSGAAAPVVRAILDQYFHVQNGKVTPQAATGGTGE